MTYFVAFPSQFSQKLLGHKRSLWKFKARTTSGEELSPLAEEQEVKRVWKLGAQERSFYTPCPVQRPQESCGLIPNDNALTRFCGQLERIPRPTTPSMDPDVVPDLTYTREPRPREKTGLATGHTGGPEPGSWRCGQGLAWP